MSIMLAVHRSGVTLALQTLESEGLIRSTRGLVTILDRKGLIETAAGSYGMPEQEYRRLLNPVPGDIGISSQGTIVHLPC